MQTTRAYVTILICCSHHGSALLSKHWLHWQQLQKMSQHRSCFDKRSPMYQFYILINPDACHHVRLWQDVYQESIQWCHLASFFFLNTEKAEILILGLKQFRNKFHNGSTISQSPWDRNLSILVGPYISFEEHISSSTKTANFHSRNIAKIHPILAFVYAFVSSRFDLNIILLYCIFCLVCVE